MKREAGWIAGPAMALAAMVGVSSLQSKPAPEPSSAPSAGVVGQAAAKAAAFKSPCTDLRSTLAHFYFMEADDLQVPIACNEDKLVASATRSKTLSANVRVIVATLPDPLHTHLSLVFDRGAEAIQQAAQDQGYTYDSSWLPWESASPAGAYPLLVDQETAADRTDSREEQPGVLLFRKSLPKKYAQGTSGPFRDGLMVFIVAEQPTGGLHRAQFINAARWINSLRAQGVLSVEPAEILGPSFSGSLPSLAEVLKNTSVQAALTPAASILRVYSGQATSGSSVNWFLNNTGPQAKPDENGKLTPGIQFLSFQLEDDDSSERLRRYLSSIGVSTCSLAIVSEDETAFGSENGQNAVDSGARLPPNPCWRGNVSQQESIPSFYYPRDISALRAAYQEQSLFSKYAVSSTSDTSRRTLRSNLEEPEGKQQDTIRSYGGSQTAMSQEAVLLQIVGMLRAHQSQFILLRSSNPLDQLFLAHFFKLTYPEGRVVVMGNDLLLRREAGINGLTGILTLSTYPLLPQIDDWTQAGQPTLHSHRSFTQDGAEGTYIAMRALLRPVAFAPDAPFLPAYRGTQEDQRPPDYAPPFWLTDPARYPDHARYPAKPLAWLTVLGTNGFWPVAALVPPDSPDLPHPPFWPVTLAHAVWAQLTALFAGPNNTGGYPWPDLPLNMKVALVVLLFLACFHAFCSCSPAITVRPDHRCYFVRPKRTFRPEGTDPNIASLFKPNPKSHISLLVFASALLVYAATVLCWSYGGLSGQPAPIPRSAFYAGFPMIVWLVGAAGLVGNAYIEHKLDTPAGATFSVRLFREFRNWWPETKLAFRQACIPLLAYTVLTAGFYIFVVLWLDSHLPPEARTLTYLRSMNLTAGVSPAVPLLLLTAGLYGWSWYSLRGLALFGADRPLLPLDTKLLLPPPNDKRPVLSMLGDGAAGKLEKFCWPFYRQTRIAAAVVFLVLCIAARFIATGIPLRSLGIHQYSTLVCVWIAISISVLLANAWQLAQLWLRLRVMLTALDKLPLRRTMRALHGYTWGSIWKMGSNVFEARYQLFYRQYESLIHLQAAFKVAGGSATALHPALALAWHTKVTNARLAFASFAAWYGKNWDRWAARDLCSLRTVQETAANLTGDLISELLVPAWNTESKSLLLSYPKDDSSEDENPCRISGDIPQHIIDAEETVCLVYLGYLQNILGRMRSIVLGMVCLFLSVAFVLPSYPFDPRPALTGAVVFLFLTVGTVIFTVYSQMFRDATLSHLTNTKPGELGSEFWLKFLSFGVGPVFGLLATIFPQMSNLIFSWLQPSLASIK